MKEIGSCQAIIYKVQTTVDGGARLTLDLPASEIGTITGLLKRKMVGEELVFVAFVEAENE